MQWPVAWPVVGVRVEVDNNVTTKLLLTEPMQLYKERKLFYQNCFILHEEGIEHNP